jgi:hypothetical protein
MYIALGIDNLWHGFWVSTQLDPGWPPDQCPAILGSATRAAMSAGNPERDALTRSLVAGRVAVTSTLAVFEGNSISWKTLSAPSNCWFMRA